jgi:hypothetical protein
VNRDGASPGNLVGGAPNPNSCEVCGLPVNQQEPHVRAGIIERFVDGKMVKVSMWHLRCWDPSLPRYQAPTDEALEEHLLRVRE